MSKGTKIIVILDNASFHKKDVLIILISANMCVLRGSNYLLPIGDKLRS